MEQVIFSSLHTASLLEANKIEEVKAYLGRFFFKVDKGYIFLNRLDNKIDSVDVDSLRKYVPKDLTNHKFFENVKHTKPSDKFSALTYLQSSEFCDHSNTYGITVNMSSSETISIKNEKVNGIRYKRKCINLAKPLPFEQDEIQEADTTEYKEQIHFVDEHLRKILCSGDEKQFQYLRNFLAFTVKGVKVRTAVYAQSGEGTGKSIIFDGMLKNLLGERHYTTSSKEEVEQYTFNFQGRTCIVLDEMPIQSNYSTILDKLKSLITQPNFGCRGMYQNVYEQVNTFNIILTTNNNAISIYDNNKRRWFVLDISDEMKGNNKYFSKLASIIEDDGFSVAYTKHLYDIYEKNKNFDFDTIPISKERAMKLNANMPKFYRFIKEEYILKSKNIQITPTKLYEAYRAYSGDKHMTNITLSKKIKDIGVKLKKMTIDGSRKNFYCGDYEELYKTFISRQWIIPEHEYMEEDDDNDNVFDYSSLLLENSQLKEIIRTLTKNKKISDATTLKEIKEILTPITIGETKINEQPKDEPKSKKTKKAKKQNKKEDVKKIEDENEKEPEVKPTEKKVSKKKVNKKAQKFEIPKEFEDFEEDDMEDGF